MIYLLGDVHAAFRVFDRVIEQLSADPDACVIQVGDFGVWPEWEQKYDWAKLPFPVYFVDGNHEMYPLLPQGPGVHELLPNLYFVGRGSVVTIQGKRIGFCGGAESVDRHWRTARLNWFFEERVTPDDVTPLLAESLDMIVTHSPPEIVRNLLFPPLNLDDWNLPAGWTDVSMRELNTLWTVHQNVPWYCGHMHKSCRWQQVQILDINELVPAR